MEDRLPPGVFQTIPRAAWARLADGLQAPLTATELVELRGLGDEIDLTEVQEVHLPLSRLLALYAEGTHDLGGRVQAFLGDDAAAATPFVIGVAGSVAVGKSTVARLLRDLLSRWPSTPRVELVTTDGFLYSNAELERRGLFDRKGFPESYDRRALISFVAGIKSGAAEVRSPVYSHLKYDIVPDAEIVVRRPDVLIVEGLNVLQPPPPGHALALSDLFDFSIYVDADEDDIAGWYIERFKSLRGTAFANPLSYFTRFAGMDDAEAEAAARGFWEGINLPNLHENVLPTRERATLILRKRADHSVEEVLLRKA